MSKIPLCFLSYAGVDAKYMFEFILPILRQLKIDLWLADEQIQEGVSISETLIKGIKKSDFVICLVNSKSTHSHFEIGAALGSSKPVLAIVAENHDLSTFHNQISYLKLNETPEFGFPPATANL